MIERAPFGRTGHASSRVIFGGAMLPRIGEDQLDGVLDQLLAAGVNHLDVAPSYGKGLAESRLAPWLARHRDDFFLATKTKGRTADEARASLEESLGRLGVDRVDLIQLHNLVEEEDWATAHGPGGAVEGLLRARDEGLARFVGVTGHGTRIPAMHLRSLERFDFDSVLFPVNFPLFGFPGYAEAAERLLATCAERDVAVQAIKFAAVGRWEQHPAPPEEAGRSTWYETLQEPVALARAADFVLGRGLFLVASSDLTLLAPTLEHAAHPGEVPSDAAMAGDREALGIRLLFDGAEFERA